MKNTKEGLKLNRKVVAIFLLIAVFCLLLISTVRAQRIPSDAPTPTAPAETEPPITEPTEEPIPTEEPVSPTREVPSFLKPNSALNTPVRIVISYVDSQNYSLVVHSTDQTSHQETHNVDSPEASVTFKSSASDIYDIKLKIRYDGWVEQTLTVTIYENNQTGDVSQYIMYSKGFDFEIHFTTSPAVTYPSTEEIVNIWWFRGANMFSQFSLDQQHVLDMMAGTNVVAVTSGVVADGIAAVLFVIIMWVMRRVGRLEGAVRRST